MSPEQFCYWLKGYSELTEERPTPEQWKMIEEHLSTVLFKITPERGLDQTWPITLPNHTEITC